MQFLFGFLGGAIALLVASQARPRVRKVVRQPAQPQAAPPAPVEVVSRIETYYRVNLN
jgi:hypothetical protein